MNNQKADERNGRPSASSMWRYAMCPWSWKASAETEPFHDSEREEWAESGERIHKWLETGGAVLEDGELTVERGELNDEEMEVAQACEEQAAELINQLHPDMEGAVMFKEQRLWRDFGDGVVFSGKADTRVRDGFTSTVIDYKSGWGETQSSEENLQLRSLAVLEDEDYLRECGLPLSECNVAIIQPRVSNKPIIARYSREDLAMAAKQTETILRNLGLATEEHASAGKWCDYCPAKDACAKRKASLELVQVKSQLPVSAEEINRLLSVAQVAEGCIKDIRKVAKAMLKDDPESLPDWEIGKGSAMRSIKDVNQAFSILHEAELLDQESFLGCVKVGLGDLEKQVASHTGRKKAEVARELKDVLRPVVAYKEKAGSLQRRKA